MQKPRTKRLAEQAHYQRAYRDQQRALRKPSRDDVARVAPHVVILEAPAREDDGELARLSGSLIARLVVQGFDHAAAGRRVDELVDRCADGWSIQRKPHLLRPRSDKSNPTPISCIGDAHIPATTPANGVDS
ncbi:MAG: hypothetical protein HZA66_17555 [Rhodopseudomonas palustris]|uniref:Uncharacterized protein n=1 Tax=Rhodopseudomonas palustris TaxID=1076 RepID=A0A933RZE0_RHOPL|nr:hypothetical protein [Rhodopseudomonas palustris]